MNSIFNELITRYPSLEICSVQILNAYKIMKDGHVNSVTLFVIELCDPICAAASRYRGSP